MRRRQTSIPKQWLVIAGREGDRALSAARRMRPRSGVLITGDAQLARIPLRLRIAARTRRLLIIAEHQGTAARVHDLREIRRARLRKTPLLFLSPLFPTATHPDWHPQPRMRAAALARLAGRPLIALGGMTERRFARVRALGFDGWAGIGAWLRT